MNNCIIIVRLILDPLTLCLSQGEQCHEDSCVEDNALKNLYKDE